MTQDELSKLRKPREEDSDGMQDDEDSSQGSSNPHRPSNVVLTMVTQDAKNYVKCLRYSDREEDAVEALNALLEHHGHLVWASKELARIRAIRRCATHARPLTPQHIPIHLL
jgi:hypothetical protein